MTTLALAKKFNCHLVELEYGDPDSPSYAYLTDWSTARSDLTQTWTSVPHIAFTFPPNTGGLEEQPLKVEALRDDHALFASLVSGEPHSPVYVSVTRVSLPLAEDGGDTQYHVLAYRFRVVKATGNAGGRKSVVRLDAVSPKGELAVPLGVPSTAQCPWQLFGRGCGLALISDDGTLSAIDGTDPKKVTITGLGSAASLAPGATSGKFWHRGYVERAGALVAIRDWSSGAATTFYLASKPPAAWVGQTVTVVPGCDKTPTTCEERFDNLEKFNGTAFASPNHHPVYEAP